MKKIILLVLVAMLSMTGLAIAEDVILDTTINVAVEAMTKNDNPYVRFIITEPRELNGVQYNKQLPVMAFGDMVEPAKALKVGDNLKCVANFRKLPDGRESYTILSFIQ